ncbi:MAG: hypothetical protein JXB85_17750 [Anaerolineales bacterium]|nr:hypothetical protein [Anaerolineales bacterium]
MNHQGPHLLSFVVLFALGAFVFLLPIQQCDYLRLRYILGLWFFVEAAFQMSPGEQRQTLPLYRLVWRYNSLRDKFVAGIALAVFFSILFLAVAVLMENMFFWVIKLTLAVATVLLTWLAYYGICYLFGSQELRDEGIPKFIRGWIRHGKKL